MRRILMRGTPIFAAVALVRSDAAEKQEEKTLICKPSDLPIYTNPLEKEKPLSEAGAHNKRSKTTQAIEEAVGSVRVEISKVCNAVSSQKKEIGKYYDDGVKQTKFIREYLQEEDNTLPRVGAIAVGGLSGIILGIRGGFFRKLFYGSVVGGGVASICYPREAKKYVTIAYNFAYGIKPGDEKQKNLPQIPTSLEELKDCVVGLSSSAYQTVFPSKK